jgi:hypothetical protein
MILQEILDSVYPFKLKKHADGMSASFVNANKKRVSVSLVGYHIPETGWSYEIQFAIKNSTELTGDGDQFKIFATVSAIVQEFLKVKSDWRATGVPVLLFCTADSGGRQGLYKKLVQRVITGTKFKIKEPTALPKNVQEWWSQLEFSGDSYIMATTL